MGEMRNSYKRRDWKTHHGRTRSRWNDDNNTDSTLRCEDMDWIHLAQNRIQ
jgi:hypothetical protein